MTDIVFNESETVSLGERTRTQIRTYGSGQRLETVFQVEPRNYAKVSRSFLKRPKPLTPFIKPTAYERSVETITHGLMRTKSWSQAPVAVFQIASTEEIGCGSQSFHFDNLPFWVKSPAQRNRVIIDALLQLKDQKVNLAQAYAERRMTAGLVGDSLHRIARSIMALRRGNWRQAGRWLKQNWKHAPGSWLEYQYGWNPLMNDVFGSIEALKARNSPSDWLITVKDSVMEKEKSEEFVPNTDFYTAKPFWRMKERSRGHFIRLDYEPGNDFLSCLSSLGLTNPLYLAWELVPYSFVIDWFTPIGDWLSSLDAAQGFKFYSGSITSREEEVTTLDNVLCLAGTRDGLNYTNSRYQASRRRFHVQREVLTSSPLPGFPGYKNPLSLAHAANGLALLTQALRPGPVRVR
jgi:hypothetical protein